MFDQINRKGQPIIMTPCEIMKIYGVSNDTNLVA